MAADPRPPKEAGRRGTIVRLEPARRIAYLRDDLDGKLVIFHEQALEGGRFDELAAGEPVVYRRNINFTTPRVTNYRARWVRRAV